MKESGKDILVRFKKRWLLQQLLENVLYALGPAIITYFVSGNMYLAITVLDVVFIILLLLRKPWGLSLKKISAFIDEKLEVVEYSSGLLLSKKENLSDLALVQRQKVIENLEPLIADTIPKQHLKWSSILAILCLLVGYLIAHFGLVEKIFSPTINTSVEEKISFQAADSLQKEIIRPRLNHQELTIDYPNYTGKPSITISKMNVKALEGSRLTWRLIFDTEVDSVFMESNSLNYQMKFKDGQYTGSTTLTNSGFYNFKFIGVEGGSYLSDLYALELIEDKPPVIAIEGIDQFTEFEFKGKKLVRFKADLNDDYGIQGAQIIATVSKGSGESVKFREEKFAFDDTVVIGSRQQKVSKTIDLDRLNMDPGDELYFYVEAQDKKRPRPNVSRSETYFAVIKDTLSEQFAVVGTMGADLMPDYFRSQRQLIIDTEKLISKRRSLKKEEFNFTSNELGFDQKALRLKYGQFMGDEADSGIQVTQSVETESTLDVDNPLARYSHDHDGDNEHNQVDHEEVKVGEEEEDPLHDYLHNHDDPEESTLFTKSLKSKLREAMAQMWDAELHLRLYTPEKSLPFQYKALKLIQEIKNSARIYVHRIGFDPPPIKEDKRLTGELGEIKTFQKKTDIGKALLYPNIRKAIQRLEALIAQDLSISDTDKDIFTEAGNELASKAIEEPSTFLRTLQRLKWLTEDTKKTNEMLLEVQQGLLLAIPKSEINPTKRSKSLDEINRLFLEELQGNER